MAIEKPRAVLDTNVFVSAFLSRNPSSPTQELVRRWLADEFVLISSVPLLEELSGKLLERGIETTRVTEFIELITRLGEVVELKGDAPDRVIASDADDDIVVASAVMGRTNYLVTYDPHCDILQGDYQGIKILKAIPFLRVLRGDS